MTKSEYQSLIEFLGKKFDGVEHRLTRVEQRLTRVEERLTRVEVFAEENRHQIQTLAKAIGGLRVRMDSEFVAVRSEMAEGFRAVRVEMEAGFQEQGNLILGLGTRVERLEVHLA